MTGSNLRRYAMWQVRDFARDRGMALLIVGILVGFAIVGPVLAMGREVDQGLARNLVVAILTQLSFILVLITLNGIISTDRRMGYFRFLFSKPVSITAYYSQLFIVYFLGFLVAIAILLGAFALFVRPVSPFGPLAFCALVFLSLGGIAFLISSFGRHDWLILSGLLLGSVILHQMWEYQEGWRRMVLSVLPPVYKLMEALPDIVNRGVVNTQDVLWLLGYSAICFAAGIYVLKRRPFA